MLLLGDMQTVQELTQERAARVAPPYRNLVLAFGAQLVLGALNVAGGFLESGFLREAIGLLVSVSGLFTLAALTYFGYQTARALDSEAAWVWAVGMLVPCVNALTLLVLSSRATRVCRVAGMSVGLPWTQDTQGAQLWERGGRIVTVRRTPSESTGTEMRLRRVAEWTVQFGGHAHTGWLPHDALQPEPTAITRVDLALAILEEPGGGFTLEWKGPSPDTSGDTWHASLDAAVSEADRSFGVPAEAWSAHTVGETPPADEA